MKNPFSCSLPERLRANFWLLASTAAALCLFLLPSKMTILLEAAIFMAVLLSVLICSPEPKRPSSGVLPVLLAAVFSAIGFHTFVKAWSKSGMMAAVAGLLHLPASVLASIIGAVGAAAAFYGFWRLARWIDRSIGALFSEADTSCLGNLKANWYFVASAAVFFCLENTRTELFPLGIPVAVLVIAMFAGKAPSLWKLAVDVHPGFLVLTALNALGICWSELFVIKKYWGKIPSQPPLPSVLWLAVGAIATLPFVWICVTLFWKWLWKQLKTGLQTMSRREWIVPVVIAVLLMMVTVFAFTRSDAFYGTEFPYDIIYTSDSHILVENNAYLSLGYAENDLRQPLFAVFAAPFMGIATFASRLFSLTATGNAIVMNWVQILVLILTLVLLSELLELTGKNRGLFLILASLSYPTLLFSLMPEQYIFSLFYVILALFLPIRAASARPAVLGAGGTLLTSLVLLPATCEMHPLKQFSRWFGEFLQHAVEFVFLMLAFCRLDIILDAADALTRLSAFSETTLTWGQRFFRYTQFVRGCVFVPPVDSLHNPAGILSWQLIPAEAPDWIGIAIFMLCMVSIVLNRHRPSARIAGAWMGFSVVILLFMGWGAPENGQILYALYFGWAFWVLLYQLWERLGQLLKRPAAVPCITAAAILLLATVNLPAIREMIAFAKACFPL